MDASLPVLMNAEVKSAINSGEPVVTLETSIVAQGMPYPESVETALAVEQLVREAGAVPVSTAVIGGKICFGLADSDLEYLATAPDILKLSKADLAAAISSGASGSTTAAATMICAHLVGIRLFATGGIGGVHLGAEQSFDQSRDLWQLSETPVIVVSSGAKSILDIPKTLEVLESLGVPVFAYRQDDFPAFWSRQSGCRALLRADGPEIVAKTFGAARSLGLTGGILVANPVPRDAEIPFETIQAWVRQAYEAAESIGVIGKALTPFMLERVRLLSEGRSLAANIALIKSNARLASEIAKALADSEPYTA